MSVPSSIFRRPGLRLWGLFTAAGSLAVLATMLGFFGRFFWFLDLFSHFRVQYFLGLISLGLLLLGCRRWRAAALFFCFAGLNLSVVLPLYWGRSAVPAEGFPLRVMLLNVNTRTGDPNRVRSVVSDADPDILVLEEVDNDWITDLEWLDASYPFSVARPRQDNFGIVLFSKLPLEETEVVYIGDVGVPSIVATARMPHTKLRVLATHPLPPVGPAYSRRRNKQLARIPEYVRSPHPVVLLGDLNVTPWNTHFRRLLDRSGLRDSAKGYGVQPTWPNVISLLRIPIDHCLHSDGLVVVDRMVGENTGSDHYPLIVDFVVLP